MTSYLDRIGAGFILANPDCFNYDYVPDELVGRESIQRELASKFRYIDSPEGVGRVILTGPVGSGKTVLAKSFCRDLQRHLAQKRNIKLAHVNCRNASTSMRVAQRIVHQFDPGHPDRGLSMGELLLSLRKMIIRSSSHLIVVLDEVDHMLRKSGNELLYQLLRIDEDQSTNGTVSLILISQEQIMDVLEPAVISKFGITNHIRIPKYDVDGLQSILTQRAELALKPGSWNEEIIRLIAEKAGPTGDARSAIELLSVAVERAESRQDDHTLRQIEPYDVSEINYNLSKDTSLTAEVIDNLPAHEMMVLLAICRRLRNHPTMTMGDVDSLYAVVCEEFDVKARSHTSIWKYVNTLQDGDIIQSSVASLSDGRGRTTHLSMPNYLPADVASRLELLIPKRLPR